MFIKRKSFRNYSKSLATSNDLYILSAVRTPIGLSKGILNQFGAPQLFTFAFKEALQRAVVPSEDIQSVFLGCSPSHDHNEEVLKRIGLPKAVRISSAPKCGIRNFINGAQYLQANKQNVCVVGGAVSRSNYIESNADDEKIVKHLKQKVLDEFVKSDCRNFLKACKNGEFYDEIARIIFRKKGQQIMVHEDEIPGNNLNFANMNEGRFRFFSLPDMKSLGNPKNILKYPPTDLKYSLIFADGAVAFVIATEDYVKKNNLTPIAKVISYAEESVKMDDFPHFQLLAVEKALEVGGLKSKDITRWEIDSAVNDMYSIFVNYFKLNPSKVNKNGGVLALGYPVGLSGAKALCHLAHSLSFGSLGCTASCDFNGSASAVIIKKFHGKRSGTPSLTLFTKKTCPLCDELKGQLKPFEGRFSLHEIDIEAEENEKYKELYKYEIPVLFLEGRFLCKHKLEVQHFNRRLTELESIN